jgi:prepilin-type N-terminal cleavage/methylation domain-containing protein
MRNVVNCRKGLSLVEILCVIAIILLLMALTLPALLQAKGQSKKTVCIAQMRQIGIAYHQYREDFGEFPRSHSLSALTRSEHLNDARLVRCPDDPFDGMWRLHYMCLRNEDLAKESYYLPFRQSEGMWEALLRSDPNPGIAVCRVHGLKSE